MAAQPACGQSTEPKPFPRLIPQNFGGLATRNTGCRSPSRSRSPKLEVFYRRTLYGKLLPVAMSEDAFAARARGIPTGRIRSMSYVIAGAMGGLAGFAAGQLTFAYFALGLTLTLNGFIALAVGGLGSNVGALVGGAALGILSAVAPYFVAEYQRPKGAAEIAAAQTCPFGSQSARQRRNRSLAIRRRLR
jgi:branched-chain amino acid transport system permease protein